MSHMQRTFVLHLCWIQCLEFLSCEFVKSYVSCTFDLHLWFASLVLYLVVRFALLFLCTISCTLVSRIDSAPLLSPWCCALIPFVLNLFLLRPEQVLHLGLVLEIPLSCTLSLLVYHMSCTINAFLYHLSCTFGLHPRSSYLAQSTPNVYPYIFHLCLLLLSCSSNTWFPPLATMF